MSERSKYDRFQWDAEQLDEIVLSNVTFHMERMSHHGWWLSVRDVDTGDDLHLWWQATAEPVMEVDNWPDVRREVREPLGYWCKTAWTDRRGAEHHCEVEKAEHVRHRCECGATRAETRHESHRNGPRSDDEGPGRVVGHLGERQDGSGR